MCRGRRTRMCWLGFAGMHCKLPYTADVCRAEPWHSWQEGGRGGFSRCVYLPVSSFFFFCHSLTVFFLFFSVFHRTNKKHNNKNNLNSMYFFFSITKSSCDDVQYYFWRALLILLIIMVNREHTSFFSPFRKQSAKSAYLNLFLSSYLHDSSVVIHLKTQCSVVIWDWAIKNNSSAMKQSASSPLQCIPVLIIDCKIPGLPA